MTPVQIEPVQTSFRLARPIGAYTALASLMTSAAPPPAPARKGILALSFG